MRTPLLLTSLILALPNLLTAQASSKPEPKKMPVKLDAAAVHRSAIVIDTHADTPQRFADENFDLGDPLGDGNENLESIHKGNLGAEFFSIWVEPTLFKGQYARRTLVLIDAVKQQVAKHPDQMVFAASAEDIERAHREHKFAALMGIEGGHSIEDSIALLRQYYALGVRYMTLTWSNSTSWADSSGDINDTSIPHTKEGLNEFGKDVVYEMNRLGMMVDISHVADKTFYRTLVISRAPVIASHSGARALCDAPRNMTDDMLRAVAKNGGVVQVNFFSGFVDEDYRKAVEAQAQDQAAAIQKYIDSLKAQGKPVSYVEVDRMERAWMAKIPRPRFKVLIDHIDHIAKVAGVDHVGLGSDFDGVSGATPQGMDSAADLPKITQALLDRGYSAEDIKKVLGGNLLRVFRQVETVSHELQSQSH
jgi:membrane dipeptidase